MKTYKSIIATIVLLLLTITTYAQTEKYLGYIIKEYDGGKETRTNLGRIDKSEGIYYSDEELYGKLKNAAFMQYGDSNIKLTNFIARVDEKQLGRVHFGDISYTDVYKRTYVVSAMVYLIQTEDVTASVNSGNLLNQAITKALQNIREGSRLALDQIRIVNGNKEDFKDQIVEILLDEGYKVVAKDYLEKLYEEQKAQQSGIYNERTTVQENNFSAVGYYINVKQTETAIKVQVINVSTGEYEANVTVNL